MTVMAQYEKYIDAAKQGDVDAQYNVGLYYYRGQGVEKTLHKHSIGLRRLPSKGMRVQKRRCRN